MPISDNISSAGSFTEVSNPYSNNKKKRLSSSSLPASSAVRRMESSFAKQQSQPRPPVTAYKGIEQSKRQNVSRPRKKTLGATGPWKCSRCTFENETNTWRNARCEMCANPRGQQQQHHGGGGSTTITTNNNAVVSGDAKNHDRVISIDI